MKTLLSIVALAAFGLSVSTSFAAPPSLLVDNNSYTGNEPMFYALPEEAPSFAISPEVLSEELANETAEMPVIVSLEISASEFPSVDLAAYGFEQEFNPTTNTYKYKLSLQRAGRIDAFALSTQLALEKPRPFGEFKPEITRSGRKHYLVTLSHSGKIEAQNSEANATEDSAGGKGEEETEPVLGDVTNDGLVNIDDLLTVINAWGTYDWPTPVDIAPIGEPDYEVNMNDLMLVLWNWGG